MQSKARLSRSKRGPRTNEQIPRLQWFREFVVPLGTLLVAVVGATIAIGEYRSANATKARELRFAQARTGRELVKSMIDDPEAAGAMKMLDGTYMTDIAGAKPPLGASEVARVLDAVFDHPTAPNKAIVTKVDALFFHFCDLDHAIATGLVLQDDVSWPASYYAALAAEEKQSFTNYLRAFGADCALHFLDRFPDWRAGPVAESAEESSK